MNRDYMLEDVIQTLQQIPMNTSSQKIEEVMKHLAKRHGISSVELYNLHNGIKSFNEELKTLGGEEIYEKTDIVWIKTELELLMHMYQFFQKSGISVIVISEKISKEGLSVFPKTKSQLQNTYYKLRNRKLEVEMITKQKPGRKPGQEYKRKSKQKKEESMKYLHVTPEPEQPNLVHLLSGMIQNFQSICGKNEENERQMYQLINGIYELSNMAVNGASQEHEVEADTLREEMEQLKQEKDTIVNEMNNLATHIEAFVQSSDVEQIKGLSQFVDVCKQDLDRIQVYKNE